MKASIVNLAVVASITTGAAAQPHRHGHQHLHKKHADSPVEKREVETTYVAATVTQYVLGDKSVSPEEASAGLDRGLYVIVGETTPTFTPPPAPAATTTSSSKDDGVFLQLSTSASSSSAVPTTSTYSAAAAASSSSTSSSSSSSGATGIDADFPDGEIKCSQFPSDYGAVALDYLGFGGFSGIQITPKFSLGDSVIDYIETFVSTMTLGSSGFYSYACPEGYVKSQWPSAQGATGQSIGGLYCNSDGYLELTRGDVTKKLCEKGVEGITINNKLDQVTSFCRTDYPGTENMVIPLGINAGSTRTLANVESSKYYVWEGKKTTLQYYVNKAGVSSEEGCRWVCENDPDGCGDKAPIVVGAGKSDDGTTYLSIFPNSAVSTATLDYNIDITGDITTDCYYHVGEGFAVSTAGCTTGLSDGGSAVITLSKA
ncbi:beta-glucosidase-domain-containing protein [Biscogniauxia mediterranea]|nr:beta-glucosidase-domain-containing protein [Biscogniauxia mediterranea]